VDASGWKTAQEKFLFRVQALSQVFQGKFCQRLQELYSQGQLQFHGQLADLAPPAAFQALVRQATAKAWDLYAKKPFANRQEVLRYLSRYTHRVAIANGRLLDLDRAAGTVRFRYQLRHPYGPPEHKSMTPGLEEFLRRFCLHLLPERLVKIRHYGWLSNRGRRERVERLRALLAEQSGIAPEPAARVLPENGLGKSQSEASGRSICPYCGQRALVLVETIFGPFDPLGPKERAPP
jgi:hypothetical protein